MKIYTGVVALLGCQVWAGKKEMKDTLDMLKVYYQLTGQLSQDRVLPAPWLNSIMGVIDGYGCWCYFENDHGKGRGQPQNDMDAICKVLHDGYECILQDADAVGEAGCIPWAIPYNSATGLGQIPGSETAEEALRSACVQANMGDNCQARACAVENYFVVKVFEAFLQGVQLDTSLKHSLGTFDPEAVCPVNNPIQVTDNTKLCCGAYPIRYPFKPNGGERDCCGQKTFLTTFSKCCPDLTVQSSLNC